MFNIRRSPAKYKVFNSILKHLLYANDCDLVAHIEIDMERILSVYSDGCIALGLTVNIEENVMYNPVLGKQYSKPNIYVYGNRLSVVDQLVYPRSTVNPYSNLANGIPYRIKKASQAFGRIEKLFGRQ